MKNLQINKGMIPRLTALLLASVLMLCGCAGNGGTAASSAAGAASQQAETETETIRQSQAGEETAASAVESAAPDTVQGAESDLTDVSGQEEAGSSAGSAPAIDGLTCVSEMELEYADCFHVYYYQDGYKVIDIPVSGHVYCRTYGRIIYRRCTRCRSSLLYSAGFRPDI